MLWVWLFGLSVSWANACVTRDAHAAHANHEGSRLIVAGSHLEPPALTADADCEEGEHAPNPAREACKSFCDAEQTAVAKLKIQDVNDALQPVMAPATCWAVATIEPRAAVWRPLTAPPPTGPSVAIRFLRLTI